MWWYSTKTPPPLPVHGGAKHHMLNFSVTIQPHTTTSTIDTITAPHVHTAHHISPFTNYRIQEPHRPHHGGSPGTDVSNTTTTSLRTKTHTHPPTTLHNLLSPNTNPRRRSPHLHHHIPHPLHPRNPQIPSPKAIPPPRVGQTPYQSPIARRS